MATDKHHMGGISAQARRCRHQQFAAFPLRQRRQPYEFVAASPLCRAGGETCNKQNRCEEGRGRPGAVHVRLQGNTDAPVECSEVLDSSGRAITVWSAHVQI